MSDLDKVVQKLTEANQRLAKLEEQNTESGTAASIIAQSLPEVLNDRSIATGREQFDKREKITETDDNVKENTKTLSAKIDTTNLILKDKPKDVDPNFIGPMPLKKEPKPDTTTGADEEDKKDRLKQITEAFNKSFVGKGILSISKSISGFVGGMLKTVTGGASAILKGIITASALGLIIKFLQSDMFKNFLSEENLTALSNFFKNIGTKFKEIYNYLVDPANKDSLMSTLTAAGIIASIILITSGVKLLGSTFLGIASLFGVNSALTKATTSATTNSKTALAKNSKFLRFLKVGGFVGLALGTFNGIEEGIKEYSKGGDAKDMFAAFVGGVLNTLSFGVISVEDVKNYISPDKEQRVKNANNSIKFRQEKIEKLENQLKDLDEKIDKGEITRIKNSIKNHKRLIENEKKKLVELEKEGTTEADTRDKLQKQRLAQSEYNKKKDKFIADELKKKFEKAKALDAVGLKDFMSAKNQSKLAKEVRADFTAKFGISPDDIRENKEKEISKTASAMEIAGEKRSKIEEKAKLDKLIKDRPLFDADYLEAVSRGNNNSGMTINNNIVNSKQEDNSVNQNKTVAVKPVRNLSFHEVYVSSY